MKNIKKAYEILDKTINEAAYANLLMKNLDSDYNTGLITQLVYGTLRNYRLVRANWRRFTKNDLEGDISVLLDLGIYMLDFIDNTPDYAIVNNIVEISKDINHQKYTRLTNALLNKHLKTDPLVFDDSWEDLSVKYSNPLWLTKLWNAHYGEEKTLKILADNLKQNKLTLRVNRHLISKDELLKDAKFTSGHLSADEIYYDGNIFTTDYFKDGLVSVQDAASQEVAHRVNALAGEKVLDACSAPGSKALHIASLRNDEGIIDAVELHQSRANLIKDGQMRLRLKNINVYTADARFIHNVLEEASYDKVLLDVPCTGFGVLKGKPEIKIRVNPSDIDEIVQLQKDIIKSATKMVKSKGSLIYSTCTLNKKENENQIKQMLNDYPEFSLEYEETIFGFETGSDSFYIAVLKKL